MYCPVHDDDDDDDDDEDDDDHDDDDDDDDHDHDDHSFHVCCYSDHFILQSVLYKPYPI